MTPGIELRRARAADAAAVGDVYLRSFDATLPTVHRPHSDDETRAWFAAEVVPRRETWVATRAGEVVALMVLGDGWVEQLYVDPPSTGQGIGARLLALAKERSPAGLRLYTFQVNAGARRFYERHGFRIAELGDGSGNENGEPDVLYVWSPEASREPSWT